MRWVVTGEKHTLQPGQPLTEVPLRYHQLVFPGINIASPHPHWLFAPCGLWTILPMGETSVRNWTLDCVGAKLQVKRYERPKKQVAELLRPSLAFPLALLLYFVSAFTRSNFRAASGPREQKPRAEDGPPRLKQALARGRESGI